MKKYFTIAITFFCLSVAGQNDKNALSKSAKYVVASSLSFGGGAAFIVASVAKNTNKPLLYTGAGMSTLGMFLLIGAGVHLLDASKEIANGRASIQWRYHGTGATVSMQF